MTACAVIYAPSNARAHERPRRGDGEAPSARGSRRVRRGTTMIQAIILILALAGAERVLPKL